MRITDTFTFSVGITSSGEHNRDKGVKDKSYNTSLNEFQQPSTVTLLLNMSFQSILFKYALIAVYTIAIGKYCALSVELMNLLQNFHLAIIEYLYLSLIHI